VTSPFLTSNSRPRLRFRFSSIENFTSDPCKFRAFSLTLQIQGLQPSAPYICSDDASQVAPAPPFRVSEQQGGIYAPFTIHLLLHLYSQLLWFPLLHQLYGMICITSYKSIKNRKLRICTIAFFLFYYLLFPLSF